MTASLELVVLSDENQFQDLKPCLESADFALAIVHCKNLDALIQLKIQPFLILIIPPFKASFVLLNQEFPKSGFILLAETFDESTVRAFVEATSGQFLLKSDAPILALQIKSIVQSRRCLNKRDETIKEQQSALVSLATSQSISAGDWLEALREICSVTAKTLNVSRVGVWLFDSAHTKIEVQMLYKLAEDSYEQGFELYAKDYPSYFVHLKENRVIVTPNARTDPETFEFAPNYLQPLDIYSMLDAPIRVAGECIGLVCFEQQGAVRHWTIDEQVFAGAAADMVALLIESLEHRRIEEAIKHTEKLQSLGLLASGIAHDFNNLLTIILSQSSLIADSIAKDHPASKSLQHIINTTRQASALTKQLLTYAGNKVVQIAPLSLKDFMEDHEDFLRLALAANIKLQIGDSTNLGIEADVTQLQQVLMNLLINAAEAIGSNVGIIQIEFAAERLSENFVKPNCYKSEGFTAGDYIRLTVRDTGQGIDEATINRIFEPFFSTKSSGRGVGLATILGVVRAHEGLLWLESQRGKGTAFHLYFRRASVELLEKTKTGAIPMVSARTILVVDDAPEIVESISEILEINGLNTLTAYNGADALNIYRDEYEMIDLVLVDMSMPGLNGAETFTEMRKIKNDAKVILLSGYTDSDVLRQFPSETPTALLSKPYDVKTLLETVWKHLAEPSLP